MTEFWNKLSERERALVSVAGVLALILILSIGIVSPLKNWREEAGVDARRAQNLYRLVAEAAAQGGGGGKNVDEVSSGPIRNIITVSAQQNGVQLDFVNARQDGAVETNISDADPATLFNWIRRLSEAERLDVVYADLIREKGNESKIRGRLIFSRQVL